MLVAAVGQNERPSVNTNNGAYTGLPEVGVCHRKHVQHKASDQPSALGDVVAQLVECRPRDPMDAMDRGFQSRPEHKKNVED